MQKIIETLFLYSEFTYKLIYKALIYGTLITQAPNNVAYSLNIRLMFLLGFFSAVKNGGLDGKDSLNLLVLLCGHRILHPRPPAGCSPRLHRRCVIYLSTYHYLELNILRIFEKKKNLNLKISVWV